jgi:hypothetical protein
MFNNVLNCSFCQSTFENNIYFSDCIPRSCVLESKPKLISNAHSLHNNPTIITLFQQATIKAILKHMMSPPEQTKQQQSAARHKRQVQYQQRALIDIVSFVRLQILQYLPPTVFCQQANRPHSRSLN